MIAFIDQIEYTCPHEVASLCDRSIFCRADGIFCQQFFNAKAF